MAIKHRWQKSVALLVSASAPASAFAQGVDDNAVASASDAFGVSVGNESIGIYSSSDVRGFNPVDAGNTRIEGLYYAPIGSLPARLLAGSTIRVGIAAQGYSFPAPTGIVDYRLNVSGEQDQLTASIERGQFGSWVFNAETQLRLTGELGAYAGGSFRQQQRHEGGDFLSYNFAGGLAWRPYEGASITAFAGTTRTYHDETPPLIFPSGSTLPPKIERGPDLGQSWSDRDNSTTIAGGIAKLPFGPWLAEAGLFITERDAPLNFFDAFADVQPDGTTTNRLLIVDAGNRDHMRSGEFRLTRTFGTSALAHRVTASLRGRKGHRRFGGADAFSYADLIRPDGDPNRALSSLQYQDERLQPDFEFGPDDFDSVEQATFGIGYSLTSPGRFSLDLGLSANRYRSSVDFASEDAPIATRDNPVTGSVTGTYNLSRKLALYGGYVRGFEEVPVAPDIADNRGETPPAIRTKQKDFGFRYAFTPELSLVAGVFSISKPYYNLDGGDPNLYRELGHQSSKGVEVSLAGQVRPGLTFVLGHVTLDPKISGELVDGGDIGPRPVGSITRRSALNMDWRLDGGNSPLSLDVAVESLSKKAANSGNTLFAPAVESIDLGMRYRFNVGPARALLRVQLANVLNDYGWRVFSNGSFMYTQGRRVLAELRFDLP